MSIAFWTSIVVLIATVDNATTWSSELLDGEENQYITYIAYLLRLFWRRKVILLTFTSILWWCIWVESHMHSLFVWRYVCFLWPQLLRITVEWWIWFYQRWWEHELLRYGGEVEHFIKLKLKVVRSAFFKCFCCRYRRRYIGRCYHNAWLLLINIGDSPVWLLANCFSLSWWFMCLTYQARHQILTFNCIWNQNALSIFISTSIKVLNVVMLLWSLLHVPKRQVRF